MLYQWSFVLTAVTPTVTPCTMTITEYKNRRAKNSPGAEGVADEPLPSKNPSQWESAEALRGTSTLGQAPGGKGFSCIVHPSAESGRRLWVHAYRQNITLKRYLRTEFHCGLKTTTADVSQS